MTIVMAASKMSNLESHIPTIFYHEDVKKALDELLRINDTSIIEVWTHTHTHTQTQQALLSQSGLGIKFC